MNTTIHQDEDWENAKVYIGTITTIVPATAAVILRFVARRISYAGFWWDDYMITIALVINWLMAILRWVQLMVFNTTFGSYGLSKTQAEALSKTFIAIQILYYLNAVFTKMSLLLLYHRIFGVVKYFRWALVVSGILIISFFISSTLPAIFGCRPIEKTWKPYIDGHCIDTVLFYKWSGVANMFLDVLVLCLPYPMAWRLQTTRRQKLILSGLFLLGSFVVITSILRITSFTDPNVRDPNVNDLEPSMWSSIEQSVGIICACLPTLRPIVRNLYSKSKNTSQRTKRESGISDFTIKPPTRPVSLGDEEKAIGAEPVSPQELEARDAPSQQKARPIQTEDKITPIHSQEYHPGVLEKHVPQPESFA